MVIGHRPQLSANMWVSRIPGLSISEMAGAGEDTTGLCGINHFSIVCVRWGCARPDEEEERWRDRDASAA